jgi:hypothetical protein
MRPGGAPVRLVDHPRDGRMRVWLWARRDGGKSRGDIPQRPATAVERFSRAKRCPRATTIAAEGYRRRRTRAWRAVGRIKNGRGGREVSVI